jgi:hypothetical protein
MAFHLAVRPLAVCVVAFLSYAEKITNGREQACAACRIARATRAVPVAAFRVLDVAAVEVLDALYACERARVAAR